MKRFVFMFAAVMNLLLVDQAVKAAAIARLKGSAPVVVLDGLFNLAYVENRGCAWGMFQGHVWPLAAFAVAALAFVLWKRRSIFPSGVAGVVAELTLYAGILGNLVDRLWLGYVVDLFDFHWGEHHFPCFNVADVYINVAAGLLILTSLLTPRSEPAGGKS
ncbi:MAG: signal peptidase II [Kiritimatiellae bacterium]|nr:signal peptidase II [Kiritimatiellia bacterium]